jgi:hypothetical protein
MPQLADLPAPVSPGPSNGSSRRPPSQPGTLAAAPETAKHHRAEVASGTPPCQPHPNRVPGSRSSPDPNQSC